MPVPSRRRVLAAAFATPSLLAAPAVLGQARPRLVVVGGGFGGAAAARHARDAYPHVEVTLVEPNRSYTTCPFSNLVLGGLRTMASITHDYSGLARRGANVVHDRASAIDPARRVVRLAGGGEIPYDRLVVSPGIDMRWGAIEGYDEAAAQAFPHAWQPGAQTEMLRRQLEAIPDGGVFAMSVPANPFRCPPGPYERASMVARWMKANRPRAKILVLDAKDAFSKQGLFLDAWKELYPGMIEWVPATKDGRVTRVDVGARVLETEFGARHRVDVANVVPPQRAGRIAVESGLADASGWCPVSPRTLESRLVPGIHVVGDATIAQPLPKSGFIATAHGKHAVASAVAAIEGREAPEPVYFNTCYSLVGDDYGISVVGIFRAGPDGFVETPNSGGVTPRNPDARQREMEAHNGEAWYRSITAATFG